MEQQSQTFLVKLNQKVFICIYQVIQIMSPLIKYSHFVKANDKFLCVDRSTVVFILSWLYSQLCWFWRRWSGQVREVRINIWLSSIFHTYNRTVTGNNFEEVVKIDDSTMNCASNPQSSQKLTQFQTGLEVWRKETCQCAWVHLDTHQDQMYELKLINYQKGKLCCVAV